MNQEKAHSYAGFVCLSCCQEAVTDDESFPLDYQLALESRIDYVFSEVIQFQYRQIYRQNEINWELSPSR